MRTNGALVALRVSAVAAALVFSVSLGASWYARQVSLPRYCEDPLQTVEHLERILTQQQPAGEGTRKPYVVAAKLLFLLPPGGEETRGAYLARVQRYLREQCA